jgi:pyruvate kinase
VDDLQQFCCRNKMDFVAASFVQSADDVRFIRKTLDDAGGHDIKIISKIENESGMDHYDAILAEGDGIMVARGDLAMEIPSWKVALAQKMMITKANIAGKFIVTATQMLESMIGNPLPTRAEMTDVANACFDGTDAVMLSGETANGKFPDTAVRTMAAIVSNAENSNGYVTVQCFLRDHSSKPFSRLEAFGATVAAAIGDCGAGLVVVLSKGGAAARMVSKYRAHVPQVVVTPRESVANQSCVVFGQYALHAPEYTDVEALIQAAKQHALAEGIWDGASSVIVLHGKLEPSADTQPVISVL